MYRRVHYILDQGKVATAVEVEVDEIYCTCLWGSSQN